MADLLPADGPPAARRRHRRWPWVLLVVVVVLVVGLVVADRYAASYAERTVAAKLTGTGPFTAAPQVDIEGSPFLTQAAGGDYRHVTVDGSGLTLGTLHDVRFHADLRGVHVPLSDVLSGSVHDVPVDRAEGTVVISYAEFARQTGVTGLTVTEKAGRLTVRAPVEVKVSFFHKTFDVEADGTVAAKGNDLALSVAHIRVAGISLPGFAVSYISDYLNRRVTLPTLPYGLQLRSVAAADDGLHVTVGGTGLTITTG